MNIILDPNIFELADSQTSENDMVVHLSYLSNLLEFLKERCKSHKILASQEEYCVLCVFCDHPWNQYDGNLTIYNVLSPIYQGYTNLMTFCDDCLVSFHTKEVVVLNRLNECSKKDGVLYKEFLRHLYCKRGSKEHVVFMGTANHGMEPPLRLQAKDEIFDFNTVLDINDIEIKYFSNAYRQIIMNEILVPTLINPLPNSDLCSDYLNIQTQYIENGEDKICIYDKVGTEVALRNGYRIDDELSKLNSKSNAESEKVKRKIFSHSKAKVFLSIDFRHGLFEVFNHNGEHQGEYSYVGEKIHEADTSGKHDIKVKH